MVDLSIRLGYKVQCDAVVYVLVGHFMFSPTSEEPIAEVLMRLENGESLLPREFLGAGNKKQKDSSIAEGGNVRKGSPVESQLIERLQATDSL